MKDQDASHSGEGTAVPRTVSLADDSRAVLTDLRDELSKEFSIAGMVDNGKEAIRDVDRLDPDILVPDGHTYFQPMAA